MEGDSEDCRVNESPETHTPGRYNALFLGTGDIALPAFRALATRDDTNLLGLVTQPDRPAGRKRIPTPPAIKLAAESLGLPVWQPEKIGSITDILAAMEIDVLMVMAYGQWLPRKILATPRIACLNLHASLLPRHRGAAPLQAAILAGDSHSGISVMHMEPGIDRGPVLLRESIELTPAETSESLHERLAALAPTAMNKALDLVYAGVAGSEPQDEALATHRGKLTRHDGALDWTLDAEAIDRRIRAFHPWPGTFTNFESADGKTGQWKILPPVTILKQSGQPGSILEAKDDKLHVACGRGALALHKIQAAGGRPLSVEQCLRGHPFAGGRFIPIKEK